jgi:hypothetical protein
MHEQLYLVGSRAGAVVRKVVVLSSIPAFFAAKRCARKRSTPRSRSQPTARVHPAGPAPQHEGTRNPPTSTV